MTFGHWYVFGLGLLGAVAGLWLLFTQHRSWPEMLATVVMIAGCLLTTICVRRGA